MILCEDQNQGFFMRLIVMNKKNTATMVLMSIALFVYMVFLGTLIEDVR